MLEVKELVKSYGTGKNQHRVLRELILQFIKVSL